MEEEKIIQQAEENIRQTNELIEKAEARLSETDRFYGSIGWERGMGGRFLELDMISPADREKARKELQEWLKEVDEDVARAVAQARPSKGAGIGELGMRRGMMKV
jgi:hypothetical protein